MANSVYSDGDGNLIRSTPIPMVGVDFTLRLAFKLTASADRDIVYQLWNGQEIQTLGVKEVFGANFFTFTYRDIFDGYQQVLYLGASSIVDEWMFFAVTRNGTTQDTNVYLARASDPTTYLGTVARGATAIAGGADPAHYLLTHSDLTINPDARIAGLAIYQAELSESEIQAEWAQRAPTYASPYLYLPLDAAATAGTDASGNGRNYTVTASLLDSVDEPDPWVSGGASEAPPGIATETDTALARSSSHVAAPGIATETDTALAPAAGVAPGIATETDTALARSSSHVAAPGIATETDTALARSSSHVAAPGVAVEVALAFALLSRHVAAPGISTETDEALIPVEGSPPGIATETDTAFALVRKPSPAERWAAFREWTSSLGRFSPD